MATEPRNLKPWKPDIFEYLSYREYMRDYYLRAKENTRSMSFRFLARKAGFSSPNFYKLVMDDQRNLSEDGAKRVADALGFKKDEREFFYALVDFDQAEDRDAKNQAFERVSASRRFRNAGRIDSDLFEYLSHWYYPAIREMIARADFKNDPEWIAGELHPKISTVDAERAVELLLRLGLAVERDGTLVRDEPTLTTGHEVNSLAVANYHHQMIELGAASIESVDREWRDISAITACIRPDQVSEIKRRIHAFRETLIEFCDSAEDPTKVYQLNIQFFPMNRTGSDDDT